MAKNSIGPRSEIEFLLKKEETSRETLDAWLEMLLLEIGAVMISLYSEGARQRAEHPAL